MLKALDIARKLESGALSRSRLAEQLIEVISASDPEIRAFTAFDAAQLRRDVANAQDGPLLGMPVAFKDIIDTSQYPTEYGSTIYRGWRPRADAAIVSMTLAAGGVVLGKAATTEFAFLQPAPTVNPRAPHRTPGGSSSGSAAGVAAGLMPLAFGTQTGGSVIRPAAFCSVAAIKPSFNLLPTVGIKAGSWLLDTVGLFGAEVEDVAFGLAAITGRPLRVDGSDPGTPHFGVCRMPFAGDETPENTAVLERAIRIAERAGARVTEVEMPSVFAEADAIHPIIYNHEGGLSLAWEIRHHRAELSDLLLSHFSPGTRIDIPQYDAARGTAKRARDAAKSFFSQFGALLTHSAPLPLPDRTSTGSAKYNRLFTLLGTPAVNVPLGGDVELSDNIQVIAGFGRDEAALAAAQFMAIAAAKR